MLDHVVFPLAFELSLCVALSLALILTHSINLAHDISFYVAIGISRDGEDERGNIAVHGRHIDEETYRAAVWIDFLDDEGGGQVVE